MIDQLLESIGQIHVDDEGNFYTSTKWQNLVCDFSILSKLDERNKLNYSDAIVSRLKWGLRQADQDFSNLFTLIGKIDWMKSLERRGVIDSAVLGAFIASDIDHFHIEIRSMFDYIAQAVIAVSKYPEQLDVKSFEKLRNGLLKSKDKRANLGERVSEIIIECAWFSDLRKFRDVTVHNGGFTLCYPNEEGVLFQLYRGGLFGDNTILNPHTMFNENVVDFRLHSAWCLSQLRFFCDDLTTAIRESAGIKQINRGLKCYGGGYKLFAEWAQLLLSRISSASK